MIIAKFYNLIQEELLAILQNNASDEKTKQHKNIAQNSGYALLVWFIKFYGQKDLYKSYITDGKDDNSCDIIFSNKNFQGEDIYYVIQSKYVQFDSNTKREDTFPKIKKEEFGSTLNDFSVILSGGRKAGKNESFNKKYEELKKHLDNNGKVKFLFFTLAKTNEEINHSVLAFNKNYAPNISLEIIDIDRIRRDYIEFKYKEITTTNPLEYSYNSEDSSIELPIERFKDSKRDIFEFEGRTKAFTFLLKPKTIHELFKKYRYSLFFKNVRNPLHQSNHNQKIIDTLLKKPDSFWYFNNGLTAITKILPDIGVHAKKIKLEGLQIINGAQTVYSVYSAYENATVIERKAMDAYAKISLRLIGSSNEEFNLQITRYTNMQNRIEDRDFCSNDDVQQRLQNESFGTDFWYEKRRGEFRLEKEELERIGVRIISNEPFAYAYLVFHLQKPSYALSRTNDFFISRKENKDGLYEYIFEDRKVNFEDMYASYFVLDIIINQFEWDSNEEYDIMTQTSTLILSISKIILEKYFATTRATEDNKKMNLSRYIFQISKAKNETSINEIKKILLFCDKLLVENLRQNGEEKMNERLEKLFNNPTFYDTLAEKIQEKDLDIKAIQATELP